MGKLKEECGVFGIFNNKDAAALTALGLHALQHRGQEGCGIVSFDGKQFFAERRLGLVGDNFTKGKVLKKLPGNHSIGHNRYSTSGNNLIKNVQPFYADLHNGGLSIAHNGNLSNALYLRKELVKNGSIFQTTSDTETIVQLIAKSKRPKIIDRIIDALFKIQGGYALTILTNKKLIGIRDPFGIRPLVIGKLNKSYILASETCALDIIGAKFIREVENGEIVVITNDGLESIKPFPKIKSRPCIFEYIYFSRPDSIINNKSIYEYRKKLGAELAKESHIDSDLIVPVPDSGVPAAIGYAEKINKNIELGIIRNHYVGRTFIEPTQQIRSLGVKLKHSINKSLIKNKSLILIDDSLVRGTTSVKIVKMLYDCGAKEVHMRIASPPIKYPDFYGVDTPDINELLASKFSLEQMRKFVDAKTLQFLSIEGLYKSMGYEKRNSTYPQFTDHCFTGDYPIKPIDANDKSFKENQLSLLGQKL
ncbi:MAG: amidophosphoribosyltransferase [Candidatus Pelagibacter sp. TMED64]|nr:amidophosphoribosyltransferase [Candidatus Pelagibacter sp.]OUU67311.1 MAG: amidophosphoribosyltransferase [Candidatus Pelagibacter sp. TMED64]|tara:strand:+ start:8111 stop:9544 length:1434 start_codon:yes stop_codon:yes gene_type:complete